MLKTALSVRPLTSLAGGKVFDRNAKRLQRDMAAANPTMGRRAEKYLKSEVGARLADRFLDIKRSFPRVLDMGSGPGYVLRSLESKSLSEYYMLEMSDRMLRRDAALDSSTLKRFEQGVKIFRINAPEEELERHFKPNSLDCVVSCLSLHWVNDVLGQLKSVENVLKPDAPFICAVLGGDTLFELRTSLQLAELERRGGLGVHVSPMLNAKELHGLLDKAGFKLITVDVDEISVLYPNILALMGDLQWMAENNSVNTREKSLLTRNVLVAAQAIYTELYGETHPEDLKSTAIPATYQVLYVIGWKDDPPNQPQPLQRGSAQVSLKDVLGKPARHEDET